MVVEIILAPSRSIFPPTIGIWVRPRLVTIEPLAEISGSDCLIESAEFSLPVQLLDELTWERGVALSRSSVLTLLELLSFAAGRLLTLVLLISLPLVSARLARLWMLATPTTPATLEMPAANKVSGLGRLEGRARGER